MRFALPVFLALLSIGVCQTPAWADWDSPSNSSDWNESRVASAAEKMGRGEGFSLGHSLAVKDQQIVQIVLQPGMGYVLDLKLQKCFFQYKAPMEVSCAQFKQAFPLFAPLLTWVK